MVTSPLLSTDLVTARACSGLTMQLFNFLMAFLASSCVVQRTQQLDLLVPLNSIINLNSHIFPTEENTGTNSSSQLIISKVRHTCVCLYTKFQYLSKINLPLVYIRITFMCICAFRNFYLNQTASDVDRWILAATTGIREDVKSGLTGIRSVFTRLVCTSYYILFYYIKPLYFTRLLSIF